MTEQFAREVMSGQRRGLAGSVLRALFWGAQWPYCLGVASKNLVFDCGLRTPVRATMPVISVGNLTTGGTGKTPVVAFLANWFRDAGQQVGLLSRGYKSLDAQTNDEQLVLERLCPGVPQWLNADRIASARKAAGKGCDLLILDDGFQHRRLHRDLDIVLIDALNPWGYGHCLPRGLLREPLSAVRRADLVLITRADLVPAEELTAIRSVLARHDQVGGVIEIAFRPDSLVALTGESLPLDPVALSSRRCFAFCGIGNPAGFQQTLQKVGVNLIGFRAFADHHHYSPANCEQIARDAESVAADCCLTTLKDLVKLRANDSFPCPVWALQTKLFVLRGAQILEHHLGRFGKAT